MSTTIFIDGEAGTTGLRIRGLLAERRDLTLLEIDPEHRKDTQERRRLLNAADIAILCLPDAAAKDGVQLIDNDRTRVIDASSAHRVSDGWTYGFPEIGSEQQAAIRQARRVSNPGCWPQGAIAGLRPLVNAGLIPPDMPVAVHGVSGYSGGGRSMINDYEAAGASVSKYSPYGFTLDHKHMPELQRYSGLTARPLFTPAVGAFAQGMMVMTTLQLAPLPHAPTVVQLHEALLAHHAAVSGSVVEVVPLAESEALSQPPSQALKPESHNGTNRMTLHVFGNDAYKQVAVVAVYDNLGKGASGAAVQNLNLMLEGG